MSHPNLNGDPELLKMKTENAELRELKFKTEKLNCENLLRLIMAIIKRITIA